MVAITTPATLPVAARFTPNPTVLSCRIAPLLCGCVVCLPVWCRRWRMPGGKFPIYARQELSEEERIAAARALSAAAPPPPTTPGAYQRVGVVGAAGRMGKTTLIRSIMGLTPPQIRSGSLRPLGISSTKRISELPDVPSIAESGYPEYFVSVWNGVAVRAHVPDDVARILTDGLDRVMNDPAFRASLEKAGYTALRPRSPAAIAEFIDAERNRWSAVIKARNISLD